DTPSHRADMHRLATERRAAGLPVWDRHVELSAVFHNEEMSFERRRDEIVRILRASGWLTGRGEFDELVMLVDDLAECPTIRDFDVTWDQIYDVADDERVWIGTI